MWKCSRCGRTISANLIEVEVSSCPHCGARLSRESVQEAANVEKGAAAGGAALVTFIFALWITASVVGRSDHLPIQYPLLASALVGGLTYLSRTLGSLLTVGIIGAAIYLYFKD